MWTDYVGDAARGCALCGKPTTSHTLIVGYDPGDDDGEISRFVSADRDDGVAALAVCHSCYSDHDGDAAAACDSYTVKIRRVAYRMGKSLADFVTDSGDAVDAVDAPETADTEVYTVDGYDDDLAADITSRLLVCRDCGHKNPEADGLDAEGGTIRLWFTCEACGSDNRNTAELH